MDKFEIQKLRDLPIEGVAERLKECLMRNSSLDLTPVHFSLLERGS